LGCNRHCYLGRADTGRAPGLLTWFSAAPTAAGGSNSNDQARRQLKALAEQLPDGGYLRFLLSASQHAPRAEISSRLFAFYD
jgi:hypothetical protein